MYGRGRPYRLPRAEYTGPKTVAYTICAKDRAPLFTCERIVRDIERILQAEIPKFGCRSPIYCFMPDHLHLMVQGMWDDADLLAPIERIKTRVGILLGMLKAPGKLQTSFYDHIIRTSEDWRRQARYIALNPVRAGLIDDPFEYLFTGVVGEESDVLLLEIFHG